MYFWIASFVLHVLSISVVLTFVCVCVCVCVCVMCVMCVMCHVGPCHHDMARPQVADRRDGLQMWRIAAYILNKQFRTAGKGWSSSLGLVEGLTIPHHNKRDCYEFNA